MKRSHRIALVLLGGASAGALGGCSPRVRAVQISPACVYVNNYHLPGVGYYHAPFHAFYPRPYNDFDATTSRYFFGGRWGPQPYESAINLSAPTAEAARFAEMYRTDITRAGFGSFWTGGSS